MRRLTPPPTLSRPQRPERTIPPSASASTGGTTPQAGPLADAPQLRAEIALLHRVRRALRAGANDSATDLLARHERRFAHAALAPEADALRIESLLQRGERARAEARADQFFATYPNHPLSVRITRLLAEARGQD